MIRNIILTGSSGNLGKAVSKKFTEEGFQVIGLDAQPDLNKEGVDHFACDLMNADSTKKTFKSIREIYGNVNGGILLVGGFAMGNIQTTTTEDLEKMFSLNFLTAFHASQELYKWMKKSGGGKIILVGAKPALEEGSSEVLAYAISKSAVIKLAEILNESGRKDNIQATVIVPSIIDTPPNRKAMPDAKFSDWVTPTTIAENIYFLMSDAGSVLRHTTLKVYGNV